MSKNNADVNVTIRGMNGQFAGSGVELDGGNPLVPQLKPLEVVTLPANWPLDTCDALEITRAPATRPFAFDNVDDVAAYQRGEYTTASGSAVTSAPSDMTRVDGATAANAYVRSGVPAAQPRRATHG